MGKVTSLVSTELPEASLPLSLMWTSSVMASGADGTAPVQLLARLGPDQVDRQAAVRLSARVDHGVDRARLSSSRLISGSRDS